MSKRQQPYKRSARLLSPKETRDGHAPSTGQIAGTLAGAAPPWMETWQEQTPASELNLDLWPLGNEPIEGLGLSAKWQWAAQQQAKRTEYEGDDDAREEF